eukprot:TRINITY_DN1132_c0_g1_i1.p1 TRINITY_DN1132_c0_g1~~TRINITY_DN1132_c0_g1_i1.p1  ORF type:complete len:118 (+),score=7.57 TRINITY_DN1132_c0_g1_i1:69-422(+)
MYVELKNGETYSGTLVSCDPWMNIVVKDVFLTTGDGRRFCKIAESYIRGHSIKYFSVPAEVITRVQEDGVNSTKGQEKDRGGRGRGRGRGRGSRGPGRGRGNNEGARGRGRGVARGI